jgi:hypothetical protein
VSELPEGLKTSGKFFAETITHEHQIDLRRTVVDVAGRLRRRTRHASRSAGNRSCQRAADSTGHNTADRRADHGAG